MKKILRDIAAIILLLALSFFAGEWPENTPRKTVIRYDGCAIVTALVCGLYLNKTEKKK